MIYYRETSTGEVFAYPESDINDGLVKEGLIEMSPGEVQEHLNPVPAWWTDGSTMVKAAYGMEGWHKASDYEIEEMLPRITLMETQDKISSLRKMADVAVVPLQDAVDIDEATPEEEALLKLWKKYRVELNRLPEQTGYPQTVVWPEVPHANNG